MEKLIYVYRHIRHDKNEVFYVGIGSGKYYSRAFSDYKRNEIWYRIANKTTYDVEIIMHCDSFEEAKIKEIEFIALYKRKSDGGTLANMTLGGDGTIGYKVTEKAKENLRKLKTGSKLQPHVIEALRKSNKGKMISEYQKDQIRKSNQSRIYTKEAREWRSKNNHMNTPVLDLGTGLFFDSKADAYRALNISRNARKSLRHKQIIKL